MSLPVIIRIAKVMVLFGFYFSVITACSTTSTNIPVPEGLNLLPPEEGPSAALLKQKVTLDRAGKRQQFFAVTRMNPQQIDLVVVLATGQKALSVSYDGVSLSQEQHLSANIPVDEILALVQFVHWPESSIRKHYRKSDGWILAFDEGTRTLSTRSGVSVKVVNRDGSIMVENYHQKYRVVIDSLDLLT